MTPEKLDAVLPLTLADYERFEILDYSIQRFFECLGTLWIVVPDKEFKELGRTDLKEECRSTPAIAGGRMYVRTVSHLYSVGGK